MTTQNYPALGEQIHTQVLSNGLTVKVVSRPGFSKKEAYFVTDFGAVHRAFQLEGKTYEVPAGIAHFLEHKMFELPGRDVSGEFAALGANVNAFTSYDMTAYYFSCSENFSENLKLLLEFVSTPYFPEESVQREMGIIDQEIGMSRDEPDSRVFETLMELLYEKHPIHTPILGSRESIRQITPELLELCHRGFYTPGNMILCVVGDVDPQEVAALANAVLGTEAKPVAQKLRDWEEEMIPQTTRCHSTMEVAMPTFQMAFKCEPLTAGEAAIREEIVGDLAAEALFGESSALYLQMYEQGIIDATFGGGFETVDGCAILTCSGDSWEPEKVYAAICDRAEEICREGISQEDFLRMKRSAMGRRIRNLDSFGSTCFRVCAYHFMGFDYFEFPQIYADIRAEEIGAFLARIARRERCGLSVIYPKEANDE